MGLPDRTAPSGAEQDGAPGGEGDRGDDDVAGGFVEDANGSADALYPDLGELQDAPYMEAMQDETGAVLMGRRTFEMAEDPDIYADTYELQVPIFVVTHTPPPVAPKRNERLFFTFVTDGVRAAVAQAVTAAGERAVTVVGGADLTRQLLAAELVDELRVDVMPILLGAGLRLFDETSAVALEKAGVDEVGARTSLRFRVATAARQLLDASEGM